MINKILLHFCVWLVYREVVMHQHFQKFIELLIRTDVAEHDLRNVFFSFSCHTVSRQSLWYSKRKGPEKFPLAPIIYSRGYEVFISGICLKKLRSEQHETNLK